MTPLFMRHVCYVFLFTPCTTNYNSHSDLTSTMYIRSVIGSHHMQIKIWAVFITDTVIAKRMLAKAVFLNFNSGEKFVFCVMLIELR